MIVLTINRLVRDLRITNKEIYQAVEQVEKNLFKNGNKTYSLELNIVNDSLIRKINKQYRGKNKITDVLSFAWQEDQLFKTDCLGQIYVCFPQIKRQAKEYGLTIKQEFFRMFFHGVLHILGYDHQRQADANKMFKKQEEMLTLFLD